MIGIGFWEVILVLLVALVVINPKDLPKIIYNLGVMYSKLQQWVQGLKQQYITSLYNNNDDDSQTTNHHQANSKDVISQ
jgi:Sec-independent protein translocase protein TatA